MSSCYQHDTTLPPSSSGGSEPGRSASDTTTTQTTTTSDATPEDAQKQEHGLLSFLVTAQALNVDFTGITSIKAQGDVGEGGQGLVSQTRASSSAVFAFKRRTKRRHGGGDASTWQGLIAEISVLGHETIQAHPNIVRLLGLSWDNFETPWEAQAWPVFLLERASHGDLEGFMRSKEGTKLLEAERLNICGDIASGLECLHANDIVHGDIKPRNALVFERAGSVPAIKLADFGYSTIASSSTKTMGIATSWPWTDPYHESRMRYSLDNAKKMDIYSLGITFIWILRQEVLHELGIDIQQNQGFFSKLWDVSLRTLQAITLRSTDRPPPDLRAMGVINVKCDVQNAETLRGCLKFVDEQFKSRRDLRDLICSMLSKTRHQRCDVDYVLKKLGIESVTSVQPGSTLRPPPTKRSFKVSDSLQGLCLADYRVRRDIVRCLQESYKHATSDLMKADAAVELAVCSALGFGIQKDDMESSRYLNEARSLYSAKSPHATSYRSPEQIRETIRLETLEQQTSNETLREMHRNGVMMPNHHAQVSPWHFGRGPDEQETQFRAMVETRKAEVDDMGQSLGKTHPAVMNLRWTLAAALPMVDPADSVELLKEISQDIETDPRYGPRSVEALFTKYMQAVPFLGSSVTGMETAERAFTDIYEGFVNIGQPTHAAALFSCWGLAFTLGFRGRDAKAEWYLNLALEGILKVFGPLHPNTVRFRDLKTMFLMKRGRMAEAQKECQKTLDQLKGLIEKEDVAMLQTAGTLMWIMCARSDFEAADSVYHDMAKALEDKPRPPPLELARFDILMGLGKYAEAAALSKDLIKKAKFHMRMPQPGTQMASIIQNPLRDEVEQGGLPKPPIILALLVMHSMALQAQADSESKEGNEAAATRYFKEASGHVRELMSEINDIYGSSPWPDISSTGGRAGSALHRAVAKGHVVYLETIVRLGARNCRGSLHYDQAIAAAEQNALRFSNIRSILVEHRDLCYSTPGDGKRRAFSTVQKLQVFLSGKWEGFFLYEQSSVERQSKESSRIINWQAEEEIDDGGMVVPGSVVLSGDAVDPIGEWSVKGTASLTGGVTFRSILKEECDANVGYEYRGYINPERKAIGGSWGSPDFPDTIAAGTFWLYKI